MPEGCPRTCTIALGEGSAGCPSLGARIRSHGHGDPAAGGSVEQGVDEQVDKSFSDPVGNDSNRVRSPGYRMPSTDRFTPAARCRSVIGVAERCTRGGNRCGMDAPAVGVPQARESFPDRPPADAGRRAGLIARAGQNVPVGGQQFDGQYLRPAGPPAVQRWPLPLGTPGFRNRPCRSARLRAARRPTSISPLPGGRPHRSHASAAASGVGRG